MKSALILQGWYQKPESNWYPWLKSKLEEKNYTVYVPDLPTIHTDLPDWNKIKETILSKYNIKKISVVIGHSLGCLMALKLAEEYNFEKLVLVSGWDFNDLTEEHKLFWENPTNHSEIIKNAGEIYCISSDNDPYFTYFTNEEMSNRLQGKAIKVKGAGHFTEKFGIKELPEILKLV